MLRKPAKVSSFDPNVPQRDADVLRGCGDLLDHAGSLATLWLPFISDESTARASEPSRTSLQEQGDGLMKNVEEMVAHGGMGDAKAIVHHCGEAARYAETMIKQLSASDPHQDDAMTSLNEVIRQCNRVSEIRHPRRSRTASQSRYQGSCRCAGVDEIAWIDQDEQRLAHPSLHNSSHSYLLFKGSLVDLLLRASNKITDDPSKLARYLLGMGAD